VSENWKYMTVAALGLMVPAAGAQYVGKVSAGAPKAPTLRATAVYEFTGSMQKPNASRLVPVVVWDGEHYQPGGLYLAQPEPLAVAPGTQYVLEQSGVPKGFFNIGSAGELNGGWVGLGRYAPELPPVQQKKLAAARTLPRLHGGAGKGSADSREKDSGSDEDSDTPVLHRHTGSEPGGPSSPSVSPESGGSQSGQAAGNSTGGPTLHRRDSSGDADSSNGAGTSAPDPDRPTLHRPASETSSTAPSDPSPTAAPDPDRPLLHKRADAATGTGRITVTAPDPDRPHLRYGVATDEARVQPLELSALKAVAGAEPGNAGTIGQVVAISDVSTNVEDPHPFAYTWPSPAAAQTAEAGMHTLALRALAKAAQASFGPAASADAALRKAAAQADPQTISGLHPARSTALSTPVASGEALPPTNSSHAGSSNAGSIKAGSSKAGTGTTHHKAGTKAAATVPATDPLLDPELHAYQLTYDGGTTYVYSAHTAAEGSQRRYVTVIAQADFYGKPEQLFAQTTRGDLLNQVPALHLIDAVDVTGDHRAELLFDEETQQAASANPQAASVREFAIFSVVAGQATEVYSSGPGVQQ
jgi:hypothetical protein